MYIDPRSVFHVTSAHQVYDMGHALYCITGNNHMYTHIVSLSGHDDTTKPEIEESLRPGTELSVDSMHKTCAIWALNYWAIGFGSVYGGERILYGNSVPDHDLYTFCPNGCEPTACASVHVVGDTC